MEGDSVSTPTKEALREYFAIMEDTELTVSDVATWLDNLGKVTRKMDICATAKQLSEYMVDVKGYVTGEDFLLGEEDDVMEARVNCSLNITDVSVRTIVRYMTTGKRKTDADQKPSGDTETAAATTTTSTKTEEALIKLANSTTVKLPSIKEKQLTVKITMQYIKKFSQAKKNIWEAAGLFDALTAVRKNAGENKERLMEIADEYVIDQTLNETELTEFLQEISDEVLAEAGLSQAKTIVEAAAMLVVNSTTKTFEQLRLKMYKCLEKPGFVSTGYFLKNDFDAWEDNLTEIRYSDLVTDESIMEALQHFLQKFQPLVYKMRDAWKAGKGKQDKIDAMLKVVRKEIPKLEAKAELERNSGQGKGKGKGKGKGMSGKTVVEEFTIQEGVAPKGKGSKGGKGGKRTICWNYQTTGKCNYGEDCKFVHEEKGKAVRKALTESEYEELLRLREKYSKTSTTQVTRSRS